MNANDAEDWRELWSLDMPERVSLAVIRELEAYGVRVPGKLGLERANVSLKLIVIYWTHPNFYPKYTDFLPSLWTLRNSLSL